MLQNNHTLSIAMNRSRSYNLNFLRFIAALLVIYSHSFPLSLGKEYGDFMMDFSGGKLGLGGVAVGVFFLSSGLLVAKSAEKNQDTIKFFKARCLRIFPALIVVVVCCAFILGPLLTTLDVIDYFFDINTYTYLFNGILVPVHNLPNVFLENVYGPVVNGALWTMPVEFICYIGLFICFKFNLLNSKYWKYTILLFLVGFGICYYSNIEIFNKMNIYVQPVFIFYIGMSFYVYRDKIRLNRSVALLFSILWLILIKFGFAEIAMVFLFPYIILVCIFDNNQCSYNISKLGNVSYGIYLVGFPIQQIIVSMFGGTMSPYINTIFAIPFAFILGIIIYKWIEVPITKKCFN